jgi:pimeloyl-ACP methyl ester carboxylesterase
MFDEEETLLADVEHPAYGAIRVPDGRTLAWAEYGSARGVPCILIPDTGSSRLAPVWLLHDSALPSAVRLLALDRPGTGASDPIGLGGLVDPAEDLRRLVDTLAVGRVAVIGIGQGVDDVFSFAARYPRLVASVTAVSTRLSEPAPARRSLLHPFSDRTPRGSGGLLEAWLAATGSGSDLTDESTWASATNRMPADARAALGDRWKEPDFRAAVATDAEQTQQTWGTVSRPPSTARWILDPSTEGVPVHLWHGQSEGLTSVSDLRAAVGARPGWEITGAAGPTAVLGIWPQILSTAAGSFKIVSAA